MIDKFDEPIPDASFSKLKVNGGHIYTIYQLTLNQMNSVFVPDRGNIDRVCKTITDIIQDKKVNLYDSNRLTEVIQLLGFDPYANN